MAVRVLAVLSALCMVAAFALAVLLPPTQTLGQLIARYDHGTLVGLQNWTTHVLSEWVWRSFAVPLLVRPDWLLPVALGLIFGAGALTLASRGGAPQHRRRRG